MSEPIKLEFDAPGEEEEPLARLTLDYGACPTCSEVASWRPIGAHLAEFSDVVSIQMRCNRCQEVGTVELTRKEPDQ